MIVIAILRDYRISCEKESGSATMRVWYEGHYERGGRGGVG